MDLSIKNTLYMTKNNDKESYLWVMDGENYKHICD